MDHAALIGDLVGYDGWALSTSSTGLHLVLPLAPKGTRVMAWVKPFAAFKRNVSPAYAWEPVLVWPARKARCDTDLVARDWVSESITMKKGLCGAKPVAFCQWLFLMLGAEPEDEFQDLYPGTGIVGAEWAAFSRQEQEPPAAAKGDGS